MVSRRAILGGAIAAGIGGPLAVSALFSAAQAADGLPVTVVNNTGRFANTEIFMYIVGTDPASGQQGFVRSSARLTPAQLSDNGPDGFADLAIPLAASGPTTVVLPKMSGRIYFSVNDKIKFKVVPDGAGRPALQFPAGWVASDPSFPVLHDCVEFTFSDAGMFCNTTMVDMFSIPMSITLTGAKTQIAGALVDGGRDKIFAALRAVPEFARLVVGDNLRVIAPGHGIEAGLFPSTFYDSYIDAVWARYRTTDLRITANGRVFTGRVTGDQLVFDAGVAPFRKPTTKDVFFCDGALAAPNDGVTGPVAAMLGAGFNRATLLDSPDQPVGDPARFYQGAVANRYSAAMHASSVDGKAYGFAFDDVVDFASFIQDTAPTGMTVTLTPFGSSG
ncbi:glycosyl hydrolase [Planosporangium thailandense]|uniref:Glycosyl hydrolase n=1 Tax=Planosporangium thailandense TaxID=765197 RepID=A0ABX0XSC2_9ACTN|nr:beta-1,3-glucanase family protein [Planosporangium thailandense]NJC68184.1 glycosyl hydrolase [Planosporangium thailandense]